MSFFILPHFFNSKLYAFFREPKHLNWFAKYVRETIDLKNHRFSNKLQDLSKMLMRNKGLTIRVISNLK